MPNKCIIDDCSDMIYDEYTGCCDLHYKRWRWNKTIESMKGKVIWGDGLQHKRSSIMLFFIRLFKKILSYAK